MSTSKKYSRIQPRGLVGLEDVRSGLITFRDACKVLDICPRAGYMRIRRGTWPTRVLRDPLRPRQRFVRVDELEAYLDGNSMESVYEPGGRAPERRGG